MNFNVLCKCKKCGSKLKLVDSILFDENGDYYIEIVAMPCEKCSKNHYNEGHGNGHDDGYNDGYNEGYCDGYNECCDKHGLEDFITTYPEVDNHTGNQVGDLTIFCPICGRKILKGDGSKHHLIPRSLGGKNGDNCVLLHSLCHRYIHAVFTRKDLSKKFNTIEKIKETKRMIKFVNWIQQKPLSFDVPIKESKRYKNNSLQSKGLAPHYE